jgi:hypothetical protein
MLHGQPARREDTAVDAFVEDDDVQRFVLAGIDARALRAEPA